MVVFGKPSNSVYRVLRGNPETRLWFLSKGSQRNDEACVLRCLKRHVVCVDVGDVLLARVVLTIVLLLAVCAGLGAAATLAVGLLVLIISVGKVLVWEAEMRNDIEIQEFEAVNRGEKEPDPHFLERVWYTS